MDIVITPLKFGVFKTGQCFKTFKRHTKRITSIEYFFNENNQLLIISGSYDGSIKVWNPEEDNTVIQSLDCNDPVTQVKVCTF